MKRAENEGVPDETGRRASARPQLDSKTRRLSAQVGACMSARKGQMTSSTGSSTVNREVALAEVDRQVPGAVAGDSEHRRRAVDANHALSGLPGDRDRERALCLRRAR